MQLINKIEKKFNVRFTFRDIVKLKTWETSAMPF